MDNATLTSIISTLLSGIIAVMLAIIAFFFSRYIKANDAKHALHFKEQSSLRKVTNGLQADLNWLLGNLDGKNCIDSDKKPCVEPDDDSQGPSVLHGRRPHRAEVR
jgi:sensor histidine kinase regulating citrate/malate metabolism